MRIASVRTARTALLLTGAAIWLAGCSNLARTLGLVHDAPDEFTVTTRSPLAMPPDFSLPVPQPGVPRPQEQSERAQAEQALVPQIVLNTAPTTPSVGQQALVQAAGPPAPPEIRAEVDQTALQDATANQSLIYKLQFWRKTPPPGIVVDPEKEAKRLRENSALGQSQENGDTPIVQPKAPSILDGLF